MPSIKRKTNIEQKVATSFVEEHKPLDFVQEQEGAIEMPERLQDVKPERRKRKNQANEGKTKRRKKAWKFCDVTKQESIKEPSGQAKQVAGYYSNDDVTILLNALLKSNGLERIRGGNEQDIVRNLETGQKTRTMVLAPIAEDSDEAIIWQLKRDVERAHRHNIEQILVPINIPNIHWYTIQLQLLQSPEGCSLKTTVHDSLGIRKNSIIVWRLIGRGIVVTNQEEGTLPKIQAGEFGARNVYCGGYTARLIANLAIDHRIVGEEAWGCPNNIDQLLRQEDARVVNELNAAHSVNFGKSPIALEELLNTAQHMSMLRSFIAKEKEFKLIHELEEVHGTMPIGIKALIRSLNIPEDPALLYALVRNLYRGLPLLKVLFKTNEQGEIERDVEGLYKLDANIEIEQIRNIMVEFKRKCIELEGVGVAELGGDGGVGLKGDEVAGLEGDGVGELESGGLELLNQDIAVKNTQPSYQEDCLDAAFSLPSISAECQITEDTRKTLDDYELDLKSKQSLYKGNHPETATSLYNLGAAYENIGDIRKALTYLEPALKMRQLLYEGNNIDVANVLYSVGSIYESLGDIQKAIYYLGLALKMRQSLHKGDHHEVASSLSSMGSAYQKLGDNVQALSYHELALKMKQSLYIYDCHEVADSLYNVGFAYQMLRDNEKALNYYELALKMRRSLYLDACPKIADSLYSVGFAYQSLGNYRMALEYYELALTMRQSLYKNNHPLIITSLNAVGSVYQKCGDNEKALNYYERSLNMAKSLYQGSHAEVATSLHNVGVVYQKLGDTMKALIYLEPAFNMRQSLYPNGHVDVANSLSAMGSAYQSLGENDKALTYLRFALEMKKRFYKTTHPEFLSSLNAVGFIYHILGDNKQALKHYLGALKIMQFLHKGDHPGVAAFLHNIGGAYQILGDNKQACAYLEPALKMRQALYVGNHHAIANSLYSMGIVSHNLGDKVKAFSYHESALKMRQAIYGGDHFDVADSLYSMGLMYQDLGNNKKALDYYEQALNMRQFLYKGDYPDVLNSLSAVAFAYLKEGDIRKAIGYYEQALKMGQSLYKEDYPDVLNFLNSLGFAYQEVGDVAKALGYYEQALRIRQTTSKVDKSELINSLCNVGNACHKLGNYNKALDYLKPALEMMHELYGHNNRKIIITMHTIGLAYSNLGDDRGALVYLEPALSMRQLLYKEPHPEVATSLHSVGTAYQNLGDISKALPYLEAALTMRQHLYPNGHTELVASLNAAGSLYERLGEIDKSIFYRCSAYSMMEAFLNRPNQEAEFKGQGTLSYAANSYLAYYNTGLDQILKLRLSSLGYNSNAVRLRSRYFEEGLHSAEELAHDVKGIFSSGSTEMILAPVNLYNKHWLGLLFRQFGTTVEVAYMDSEQAAIAPGLVAELNTGLVKSQIFTPQLEKQRYNNCGSEVIENFVYYLTGTRATQEGAVYVHSLLVENSLLDPKEYGLKIYENNKLIGFLSNTALLPVRSIDASLLHHHPDERSLEINLLPAIKQFNNLCTKWVQDKLQQANTVIYKTTLGFKGLDLAVDSARLVYEPSLDNTKTVVLDVANLYGMYSGANGYSALVSGAEVAYQLHQGEYQKAFGVAASTLSSMALPVILAHANRPYLGFAYSVFIAASTAYNAMENAYSFAIELAEDLQTTIAGQVLDNENL